MLRLFTVLVFLVTAPLAALAQVCGTADLISQLPPADRARLDALTDQHPFARGLLWRAEKPGSTVVVAGTIHIPDPRLDALVDQLTPHLKSADLLILEATAEDEAGVQTLAATKPELFFITEGPTLIDLLDPDEWSMVTERLKTIGIPAFLAAKFQPWYLSMTLAVPPCALTVIQSGEKGLDRRLEAIAKSEGTDIAALDDTEAVLRLFADEPLDRQLDGLRITLETQDDGNASTSTLIEAYFDGRTREAWEFGRIQIEEAGIENGAEMFEEVNQTVLVDRNIAWEPKVAALVDGKDAVIAVGAAHLSGETGVLRALERAGYTVSNL
jgi:uncharacterized protein